MRILALFALTCVVACSGADPVTPAKADEISAAPSGWVEPDGRYRIDFQRFGWVPRADQRASSIVEMIPERQWTTDAYCAVWESQRVPASIPQDEVNAAMERHTRDTAVSADIQSNDLAFWHDEVDGISTVEMRFHNESLYQRWRMFRLSTPSGVVLINFVCGARLPTTSEQESELDAIVDTLRFQ